MTKKQYTGKLIKLLAIFGVPLVALMWISSASGKKKKKNENEQLPEPKPDDQVPPEVKAGLGRWIGENKPVDNTLHVAWYYLGWWIAVEVYTETVTISEESNFLLGPMARTYTYRARFRWLVMLPPLYDTPLAVGDVIGEGSASSLGPSEDAIDQARREAAQAAADAAGEWLEAFRKSKEAKA